MREVEQRFLNKVNRAGCCWLWKAAKNEHGYGRFYVAGRLEQAHRVAFTLFVGPVPDGFSVLHNCPGGDNPACVNPAHLFVGTQQTNIRDMIRKGRANRASFKGERNGRAKLDEGRVRLMRAERGTHGEIATAYGVSKALVSMVRSCQVWAHVKD